MVSFMIPKYPNVYRCWSRTLTAIMWNQWKLFDSQYKAGIGFLDVVRMRPVHGGDRPMTTTEHGADEVALLERCAAERMKKGLAPPREIYEVQNRGRIDWSKYPDWARPVDPELFEGSAHEG
jgi:hypothetical protein